LVYTANLESESQNGNSGIKTYAKSQMWRLSFIRARYVVDCVPTALNQRMNLTPEDRLPNLMPELRTRRDPVR
jgi:hypothetical protein